MTNNCYYTRITSNNIDVLIRFIEFLKKEVFPKSGSLGNLRFVKGAFDDVTQGQYLVLYQTNTSAWYTPILSLWAKDPAKTFKNCLYLDASKLLSNILKEAIRIYNSVSPAEKTIIDALKQHINNITNNTSSNENQLQRKETPGSVGNERVGTPVRYSGNKLAVAVGHLSNKARTSQI